MTKKRVSSSSFECRLWGLKLVVTLLTLLCILSLLTLVPQSTTSESVGFEGQNLFLNFFCHNFFKGMEIYARRSRRDHRAAKYGRRSYGYQSDSRRMPYRECNPNVGGVVEMGSQGEWRGEPPWGEMNHFGEGHHEVRREVRTSRRNSGNSIKIKQGIGDQVFITARETNTMTQGELDCLRESCSFPSSVQIRFPKANETIASTRPGNVVFYEAVFHAGLHLPIYPIIRRILYIYNICPTQLVPNAWRILVYTIVLWRGQTRPCFGGCRGSKGSEVVRCPKSGCNKLPVLSTIEQKRLDRILDSLLEGDTFKIKEVLESKFFRRCFRPAPKSMASSGRDNGEDVLVGRAAPVVGDEAMSKKISLKKLALMAGDPRASSVEVDPCGKWGNYW
ncbi:hypothetical protein Acr_00g0037230 [Actinidia rufa]|uniref:Uncharacterized protein n=1 Tax=Actinidia rufa TaxID=165716 RepID=A0A7J0DIP8_9ERIC|nr:hypothetical protein Acr_00g0037230 [Actinidia rufa]